MRVTLDISEEFVDKLEEKVGEVIPGIVEEILNDSIDELVKDVVLKQLKSCALIYIQGQEMRGKMMDKVRPLINEMVGLK